jgi:hypothetical protein
MGCVPTASASRCRGRRRKRTSSKKEADAKKIQAAVLELID